MIKKADIVLFLCIVVFGLAISWHAAFFDRQGNEVVVTAGGQVFGVYPLAEDREIEVTQSGHSNHITIKGGKVSMTSSICKNQVCVQTGTISHTKDSIACLPNRVIVEIKAGKNNPEGGDVDVISG